jgi:hypothetical protein
MMAMDIKLVACHNTQELPADWTAWLGQGNYGFI